MFPAERRLIISKTVDADSYATTKKAISNLEKLYKDAEGVEFSIGFFTTGIQFRRAPTEEDMKLPGAYINIKEISSTDFKPDGRLD